jgi:hypothetical protein
MDLKQCVSRSSYSCGLALHRAHGPAETLGDEGKQQQGGHVGPLGQVSLQTGGEEAGQLLRGVVREARDDVRACDVVQYRHLVES